MKKKIVNVALVILVVFFVLNSLVAYTSYVRLSDNKKPLIYFGMKNKDNYTIYNEFLYKIKVENKTNERITSLKLFFIE